MQAKKEYNQVIDILRLVSILAVLLIHTTTKTLEATNLDVKGMTWTLFLNQIARFAVPLFFMISGFVLELNYQHHASYGTYLKKRFNKILIPYVFWSLIYMLFVYSQPFENYFYSLISGGASYQLYFIPALLIFYLVFPLLHRLYKIIANKWVMLVFLIIQIGFLYYDYYIKALPYFYPLSIALLNYFPFVLGIWASRHEQKIVSVVEKNKNIFGIVTAALAVFIFWQGRERYLNSYNYVAFFSQWRPSVLIYSMVLAAFLLWMFGKIKRKYWFVKMLVRLSFLVFFIHVIVIEIVWPWVMLPVFNMVKNNIFGKTFFDPIFFILITSLSFGLAYWIQKIPVVRKIVG